MMRFSISQKIFYGFSIIILLAVSILLVSYPLLTKIDALSSRVVPLEKETNVSQEGIEIVRLLESKIELYVILGSQEARDEARKALEQLDRFTSKLSIVKDLENLRMIRISAEKISSVADTLINYINKKESADRINQCLLETVKRIQYFEETQKNFQNFKLKQSLEIATEEKEIIRVLLQTFLILELFIVFFGILASFLLSKIITRNLFKLHKVTQEIASGNFQTRVSISSKDEIGQLAGSFNLMLEELRKSTVSKDYLNSIINSMADMLIVLDPQLKIIRVNKTVSELLGYSEGELIGEPINIIFSSAHSLFTGTEFEQHVKKGAFIDYEIHFVTKNKIDIPVLFSVSVISDKEENISYVVCTAQDITVLKNAEQELRALSLTDPLTGLYNRRGLLALGEQQIKIAKRNKEDVMLLFVDMDNMKWINDTFGHAEGDLALIEIAKIMRITFREPDIIARIGGDEFAVIAMQATRNEENVLIGRLKKNLDSRNNEPGKQYVLSLSMGIAVCQAPYVGSVDEFLTRADKLMYKDKRDNLKKHSD